MTVELEVIARESAEDSDRPPLLFVHGAGHGAWCWDEHFLDFFAGHGFDCYALSLRGHGASGGRERLRWSSIADYVSDVARVASELPHTPVVVGHSLGSLVVQKYLEAHEAPAAVLLAPPRGGVLGPSARMLVDHPWRSLQVILTGRASRLIGAPELARKFFFSPELPEERVREYAARQGPESFRALLQLVYTRPNRARIRGVPMLVLGAGLDYFVRPSAIRRIAEGYGAESKVLPGLGHGMMLDVGWREAAEAILDWLERALAPEPPSLLPSPAGGEGTGGESGRRA
ncbi:MAG: lysophospholipase [Chloroflexi bacterium]|nr:lysophospholipase [Chloroflexota bacterium]